MALPLNRAYLFTQKWRNNWREEDRALLWETCHTRKVEVGVLQMFTLVFTVMRKVGITMRNACPLVLSLLVFLILCFADWEICEECEK